MGMSGCVYQAGTHIPISNKLSSPVDPRSGVVVGVTGMPYSKTHSCWDYPTSDSCHSNVDVAYKLMDLSWCSYWVYRESDNPKSKSHTVCHLLRDMFSQDKMKVIRLDSGCWLVCSRVRARRGLHNCQWQWSQVLPVHACISYVTECISRHVDKSNLCFTSQDMPMQVHASLFGHILWMWLCATCPFSEFEYQSSRQEPGHKRPHSIVSGF